jgi:hypothetical protein
MAKRKTQKQSAKATLAEVIKGNGKAEGGYVCARAFATLFEMRFLVVKNNVEK